MLLIFTGALFTYLLFFLLVYEHRNNKLIVEKALGKSMLETSTLTAQS